MVTPNPRSLGDSFPDDPRFLKDEPLDDSDQENAELEDEDSPPKERSADSAGEFQDPMTEEDTASGGPAD